MKADELLRLSYSKLMHRNMFYYQLLSRMVPRWATEEESKKLETLAVGYENEKVNLIVNRDYIERYSPSEFLYDLEHEVLHLVFDHLEHMPKVEARNRFKTEEEAKDHIREVTESNYRHKLNNIAMDRSINVYIPDLPNIRVLRSSVVSKDLSKEDEKIANSSIKGVYYKGETEDLDVVEVEGITESSFKDLLVRSKYPGDVSKVEKYEAWTYYRDLLLQCPKIEENIKNIKTQDIHFGKPGDEEEERSASSRIVIDALHNSPEGSIPGFLRDHLKLSADKYKKAEVPWNRVLRRLANAAIKSVVKMNTSVKNRHYTGEQSIPGYTDIPLTKVAVVWDTSGSCMDDEIQGKFLAEVSSLVKSGCEATIYYCDSDVEHVQKITKNNMKVEDYEGVGGGGTDLDKGIIRAKQDGNHIIIMLTDCYMSYRLTKKDLSKVKVITVSTTSEKVPKHYGTTIFVNGD